MQMPKPLAHTYPAFQRIDDGNNNLTCVIWKVGYLRVVLQNEMR